MIAPLHYITQQTATLSHADVTLKACEAGITWIQLRVKEASFEEYLEIAQEAKAICNKFSAKLIINDNVRIAKRIEADGVHLGKKDMHPKEARKILGKKAIIGVTANTKEDIDQIIALNGVVDYIGLGPYKYTTTKKNLSPVLGIHGYQKIPKDLPIIAVGGIQLEDAKLLLKTGIHGIAVSALITHNFSVISTLQTLLQKETLQPQKRTTNGGT